MLDLTEAQLRTPESVAPYAAFHELMAQLVANPALPETARVLDIGAGIGAYGELLDRWWPERFTYVGADYSDEILEVARARWPARSFVQKDVFDPGALDGFDIVLASALLDVLPEFELALEALLGSDAMWIVLHRQRVNERRSHVDPAPGYRGQQTYRSYVTLPQLEHAARKSGLQIVGDIVVEGDERSFLLERA
jgi:SAM-dependent methyltransferase